jgi:hypothetical protein
MGITSGLCEQIQWKCNTFIFHLNIMMNNWGVSHMDFHIGRYGWAVSNKYLPLRLIGRKVKRQSLLFDANNTFIQIVTTISIWELYVTCVSKSMGNAILAFFTFEYCDGQMGGGGGGGVWSY